MRKEQKRLEKADRQQRAVEQRLQASRSNHSNNVEDSGLRGRESITRSEITSSEPPGSKPDSVWSITPRSFDEGEEKDDYGETDDEGEETWWRSRYRSVYNVNYEEASAEGKEDHSDLKIMGYWRLGRL